MTKKKMQDMIPPEKRTIRRVPLGHTRRSSQPDTDKEEDAQRHDTDSPGIEEDATQPPQPPERKQKRGGGKRRWRKILIIVVIVLILLFLGLSSFTRATISIVPQHESITVNGTFLASRVESPDALPYEMFSVTRDGAERVVAVGEKYVEAEASGTIVVFNDFDENEQLLVANTRFETPEGLVYRVQEPVSVPGQTVNSDGEVVPGSVEVRVVADEPGEEYNIGKTTFTLPGLEESGDLERYEAFYANSKTAMTGGFAGTQKTVDTQMAEEAEEVIVAELTEELQSALGGELPDGFVYYPGTTFLSFASLPQERTEEDDEVLLRMQGTLEAVVFDEHELAEFIAENTIAVYDGNPVVLEDPQALNFVMLEKDLFEPGISQEFEYTLDGQTRLIWELDGERLKQDLAGKHKRDTTMVLSAYPAIEEADVTIYPFWKQTFPGDIEDIHVEYEDE